MDGNQLPCTGVWLYAADKLAVATAFSCRPVCLTVLFLHGMCAQQLQRFPASCGRHDCCVSDVYSCTACCPTAPAATAQCTHPSSGASIQRCNGVPVLLSVLPKLLVPSMPAGLRRRTSAAELQAAATGARQDAVERCVLWLCWRDAVAAMVMQIRAARLDDMIQHRLHRLRSCCASGALGP